MGVVDAELRGALPRQPPGSRLARRQAAVEEARTLDDDDLPPFLQAFVFNRLGHEAYELGNWSRAETVLEEALERWRRLGSSWGIGVVLGKLADLAQARGDEVRAAALYRESLDSWWSQGELGTMELLTGVARLAAKYQPERAVRLFAAAEANQTRIGLTLAPALRAKNERSIAAARAALGQEAFDASWSAGGGLSLDQAVAEAHYRVSSTTRGTKRTHLLGRVPLANVRELRTEEVLRMHHRRRKLVGTPL